MEKPERIVFRQVLNLNRRSRHESIVGNKPLSVNQPCGPMCMERTTVVGLGLNVVAERKANLSSRASRGICFLKPRPGLAPGDKTMPYEFPGPGKPICTNCGGACGF